MCSFREHKRLSFKNITNLNDQLFNGSSPQKIFVCHLLTLMFFLIHGKKEAVYASLYNESDWGG